MATQEPNNSGAFSIAGLIFVLGVARGFDALIALWFHKYDQMTSPFVILWFYALIAIFLAAVLLSFFWFVQNCTPRKVWVASVFILTGLLVLVFPIYYTIHSYKPFFHFLFPQLQSLLMPPVTFSSYTFLSAGFIVIIGLFILIPTRGKNKAQK